MPDGAKIAQTVISGVNSVLGSGWINALMQKKENQRQRDYESTVYDKQKQDNLDFWNLQNQYNDPAQQMQRLKQAGLNPNLVYGNGATATAQSAVQSPNQGASNSTKVGDIRPQLPTLQDIYAPQLQQAQINKLNEEIKTQETIRLLNMANAMKSQLGNKMTSETWETQKSILNASLSQIEQNMNASRANQAQTYANTNSIQSATNRANELQSGSVQKQIQEILNIKANTAERQSNLGLTKSQTAKNYQDIAKSKIDEIAVYFDTEMKANGLNPNSSGISRAIDAVTNGLLNNENISDLKKKIKQTLDNLKPKNK